MVTISDCKYVNTIADVVKSNRCSTQQKDNNRDYKQYSTYELVINCCIARIKCIYVQGD